MRRSLLRVLVMVAALVAVLAPPAEANCNTIVACYGACSSNSGVKQGQSVTKCCWSWYNEDGVLITQCDPETRAYYCCHWIPSGLGAGEPPKEA